MRDERMAFIENIRKERKIGMESLKFKERFGRRGIEEKIR